MVKALQAIVSSEQRLSDLIGKFTMDIIRLGLVRMVTREEVVAAIEKTIREHSHPDEAQRRDIQTIETMMKFSDENLLNGDWIICHAQPDKPFVIGDAPVVTWERNERNILYFGQGFGRPNVEAFLPVSSTTGLHIRPCVPRSRPVLMPATDEVNMAQATFATEHCFTSICSQELDAQLQPHFGKMRFGFEGFSVRHIDYDEMLFDILMGERR
jgi:hypothetical protein